WPRCFPSARSISSKNGEAERLIFSIVTSSTLQAVNQSSIKRAKAITGENGAERGCRDEKRPFAVQVRPSDALI
ncbi:hypothetical protein, partial [Escherichia coli]|uniref:hypothetical protein n=1 Tax=Escherichia coli TaxID=562 RepID=UPI002282721D